MNHIGLFEGIGGFSVAAHAVGWNTIAWCEINKFGQSVLLNHFPDAKSHEDITKTDFTIYRGKCDIITGGFPCQPYSLAGKRLGKDDDRHLWPEMLRAIREIQPTWVVGENVLGIVNWSGGLVFDEVQADLEAQGYEVQTYVLPAAGIDAPHRRDRVWFVAYSDSNGHELRRLRENRPKARKGEINEQKWKWIRDDDRGTCEQGVTSDSESEQSKRMRPEQRELGEQKQGKSGGNDSGLGGEQIASDSDSRRQPGKEHREAEPGRTSETSFSNYWQNFPAQSAIRDGNDGFQSESLRRRIREYLDGQVTEDQIDKIIQETTNKWAQETIKAGGNAIVPQVAVQIFNAINAYHKIH